MNDLLISDRELLVLYTWDSSLPTNTIIIIDDLRDVYCNTLGLYVSNHRRMGTLWLGRAEGLIAQNFTQITGADTGFPEGGGGFHKHHPPLPWTLSAWRHPPSGKLKNTPLPPLLLPQKKDRRCPKNWVAQKLGGGGCSPPCPPRLIRLCLEQNTT